MLQQIRVKIRLCDHCGKEARAVCALCGDDICAGCRHQEMNEGSASREKPKWYCPVCWEIGAEHRAKIYKINYEAAVKACRIREEWRREAKEKRASMDLEGDPNPGLPPAS